jgi:DNA-binding transcriptional MocR family regulator
MTVVAAFQELNAQEWIEIRPRKATFIRVNPPILTPQKINDIKIEFKVPSNPGFPYKAEHILPSLTSELPSTEKIALRDGGFPAVRLAPIWWWWSCTTMIPTPPSPTLPDSLADRHCIRVIRQYDTIITVTVPPKLMASKAPA